MEATTGGVQPDPGPASATIHSSTLNGMERILEPELMDDPAQARAYGEADFASSDQAFVDRILALLASSGLAPSRSPPLGSPPPPAEGKARGAGRILDLGCGPGNISFRLAAALPEMPVLGLDGAGAMLELAERRRQTAPERWPRLRFHQSCLPLPDGALEALPAPFAPPYTLMVSNSLLHHLHDPSVLWRSIAPWAAPGALVVVRDLRRPADPATLRELVERHAATAPPLLRRDYANSLAAAFRPEEVAAQLAAANLATLRVEPIGDRYLEISGRLPT